MEVFLLYSAHDVQCFDTVCYITGRGFAKSKGASVYTARLDFANLLIGDVDERYRAN